MRLSSFFAAACLGGLLVACASTEASLHEPDGPSVASWEEGCQEPTTVELFCVEDTCAFFRCRELVTLNDELAPRVEPARWNRTLRLPGWPRRGGRVPRTGSEPVFVIRWHNHPAPVLPSQRALSLERLERHHIFPQAVDLAEWFGQQGIHIHDYTLLIPRRVHLRIHSGGPRGGQWNAEWRHWTRGRATATHEEIWRQAIKLIVQYDLTSAQMGPYR